jgi:hypothetical protein
MAKYLHFYDDFEKFKEDYADSETAVTTAFVCSGGTFLYDRYEKMVQGEAYVWKNGDKELWTPWRTPKVGPWGFSEGTGAYDSPNGTGVEITEVITEPHNPSYYEPWVSYTEYEMPTVVTGNLVEGSGEEVVSYGACTLKFVEGVDGYSETVG